MDMIMDQILALRDRYRRDADFVSALFGAKNREDLVCGTRSLVLYGAGSAGRMLLFQFELQGCRPACFCDSNQERVGTRYLNYPVISSSELMKAHRDDIVLITTIAHTEEIRAHLKEIGFPSERVFTISRDPRLHRLYVEFGMMYVGHITQPGDTLLDLEKDEKNIVAAYHLLRDEHSKNLMIKRIALILAGASYTAFSDFLCEFSEPIRQNQWPRPSGESYCYFTNDVVSMKDHEVLVDGGAFDGDTAGAFVETCKTRSIQYDKVFCFEPDPANFERLKASTAQWPGIQCLPYGLSDSVARRSFRSNGPSSQLNDSAGGIEVQTTTIDESLAGEKVTLIKLDVEGAEKAALDGARETIRRNRPTLIVSAYHRNADHFNLVLYLREICPDYKIYMRHCGHSLYDTVLIATP